jgi:hypothetical protein
MVLPNHRARMTLRSLDGTLECDAVTLSAPQGPTAGTEPAMAHLAPVSVAHTIHSSYEQLLIEGSGRAIIRGSANREFDRPDVNQLREIDVQIHLHAVGNAKPVGVALRLELAEVKDLETGPRVRDLARWRLASP